MSQTCASGLGSRGGVRRTALRKHAAWLLGLALLAPPALGHAQNPTPAELREEAILRCYHDMGEFGTDAVNACVQAELAAAEALLPQLADPLAARCNAQFAHRGWAMVGVCVERERAAEAALAAWAGQHAAIIEACRQEAGRLGADRVKRCVESRLANSRER